MPSNRFGSASIAVVLCSIIVSVAAFAVGRTQACTAITPRAENGAIVVGRTLGWAAFAVDSNPTVIRRDCRLQSELGKGTSGHAWTTRGGVVGFDDLGLRSLIGGMNETGLVVKALYHSGFARYPSVDESSLQRDLEIQNVARDLLTSRRSLEDAPAAIGRVRVMAIPMDALGGIQPPLRHMLIDLRKDPQNAARS